MSKENLLANKYIKAFLDLAQQQGKADQLTEELNLIDGLYQDPRGRDVFINPFLATKQKVELIRKVLAKKISALTLALIELLINKRRGELIPAINQGYKQAWLKRQGIQKAKVTTATPLTDKQLAALNKNLSSLTGKKVILEQKADVALGAGARIEIGDWLLDGSIKARFAQLRKSILAEN